MDWFYLLAVQVTLKHLLQYHNWKTSILQLSAFFMGQLLHPYMTTGCSWTRGQTCVLCIARWLLNHWATREAPDFTILSINAGEACLCSKDTATNGWAVALARSGRLPRSPAGDHLSTTTRRLQRDLCAGCRLVPWEIEAGRLVGTSHCASWCLRSERCLERP